MHDVFIVDHQATGERIHSLFRDEETKITELMSYLGVGSANAIYKWFRGDSMPSIDHLYLLSKRWGVSINDILVPVKDDSEWR